MALTSEEMTLWLTKTTELQYLSTQTESLNLKEYKPAP